MYAGYDESPRSAHVRPGRWIGQRASALVAGLLVVLLALTLLAWTTVSGQEPAGTGLTEAVGTDEEPDGASAEEPGQQSGAGLSERPSGHTALVANPLYDSGRLSPLPCPIPDPDVEEPESMEEFLHGIADCLDDAWETQFERVGLPFEPPDRVFWQEPGTSPCRDYPSPAGAFYCQANASIYIGTSDVVEKWDGATQGVLYASLLAHEYGHHVQGEAGLLEYYHEQRELEDDGAERNEWTRRSELQADCFAGAFLGSVRMSYPLDDADLETLLTDAAATADRDEDTDEERTHGSADNSVAWTERGWEEQSPDACNTWDVQEDSLVE